MRLSYRPHRNHRSQRSQRFLIALLALILPVVSWLCLMPCFTAAADAAPKKALKSADPIVVMETNKGVIKVDIYEGDAPKTAANFIDLVNRGFYNGLTFHRYEPGFCIQGGDPQGTGTGGFIDPQTKRERTIPLEVSAPLKHDSAGVLAMARSNDPNSASSQFYFTLGPANFLDGKYAVFGKVVDGLETVMQLRKGDKMTKVYVQKK